MQPCPTVPDLGRPTHFPIQESPQNSVLTFLSHGGVGSDTSAFLENRAGSWGSGVAARLGPGVWTASTVVLVCTFPFPKSTHSPRCTRRLLSRCRTDFYGKTILCSTGGLPAGIYLFSGVERAGEWGVREGFGRGFSWSGGYECTLVRRAHQL
jgi:hypothetical protein